MQRASETIMLMLVLRETLTPKNCKTHEAIHTRRTGGLQRVKWAAHCCHFCTGEYSNN